MVSKRFNVQICPEFCCKRLTVQYHQRYGLRSVISELEKLQRDQYDRFQELIEEKTEEDMTESDS